MMGLEGWILPTNRNVPVRDLYEQHGFTAAETTEEGTRWRLDLADKSVDVPDWLDIVEAA